MAAAEGPKMKCGWVPKLDAGGWLNKTCSWRDWFSVIVQRVTLTHLMDSNRLPLRVICHHMEGRYSQWELCTHACKTKKKMLSTLPLYFKQTGYIHIASWLLCAFNQTSWCFCEGGRGQGERGHAVHLHARVAVLSSWPSSPDELAFGGGQGGTWIENCRQQGVLWLA